MLINGLPGDSISIRDRGLLYGDGVFRTMRAEAGRLRHWPLHYLKLRHDCDRLTIPCPDEAVLLAELDRLLSHYPDGVAKLIVTRGTGARGYAPLMNAEPSRIWDVSPLPVWSQENATHGVRVRRCDLRLAMQPRLAGIKHLNRMENVLAAAEWDDPAIAEGLLLDTEGRVVSGTRSNLFLVSNGALITPELARCGVAGVQRGRVLAWALAHGVALKVRDVALEEVRRADEVFLTNSLIGLWPVRELESRRWHEFPMSARIRHALEAEEA